MALINCPDCGRSVSDTAKSCPQCGRKIGDRSFRIGLVFYLGLIVVGYLLTASDYGLFGGPMLIVGLIMFVIHLIRKFIS